MNHGDEDDLDYDTEEQETEYGISDVERAEFNDPTGAICGHCGDYNRYADELGWFYSNTLDGDYVPTCYLCLDGKGGER